MWTLVAKESVAPACILRCTPGLPTEPPSLSEEREHLGGPARPQALETGSPPGTQELGSDRPGSAAVLRSAGCVRLAHTHLPNMMGTKLLESQDINSRDVQAVAPPACCTLPPRMGRAEGRQLAVDTAGLASHPARPLLPEQARQAPPTAALASGHTTVAAAGALRTLSLLLLLLWPPLAAAVEPPVEPLAPRLDRASVSTDGASGLWSAPSVWFSDIGRAPRQDILLPQAVRRQASWRSLS